MISLSVSISSMDKVITQLTSNVSLLHQLPSEQENNEGKETQPPLLESLVEVVFQADAVDFLCQIQR